MKKCHKCVIFPFIKEGNIVKGTNITWKLNRELKGTTKNIVYKIECNLDNCKKHYIDESERMLKDRISKHLEDIRTKNTNIATGEHFNIYIYFSTNK